MISENEKNEANAETPLPNSRKVYVNGQQHSDLRVPFREISLAPTKTMSGEIEVNEPVRVYDTSGPWGDASVTLDPVQGLPALRAKWIRDRGDVEEVEGRAVTPIDDGYLSVSHAEGSVKRNGNSEFGIRNSEFGIKAQATARTRRSRSHAAVLRAPRNHHAGNGIHRYSRTNAECGMRNAE